MVNVLGIILPAALIVLIGWGAIRLRMLNADGARGLSTYTFNVAFSALLFRIMRDVRPQDLDAGILLAYFGAALLVWAIAMAVGRLVFGLGGPERTMMGMAGAVSNNGVLGIPLVLTTWGEPGLVPLLMIMAVHSAILMSLCSVLMEWHRGGQAGEGGGIGMARRLGRMMLAVVSHPVVVAILAGLVWGVISRALGLAFPGAVELALKWLGDSAVPCGLFVLGASLAGIRLAGDLPQILATAAIKLGLQPLCAWLLGRYVFDLPPLALAVITLTAAMPTAVNVYIMADRYGVFQQRSTSIVLVSTVCGIATLAGWLSFLT